MPNTREKLIEVIRNFNSKIVPYYAEEIADKLIANGATVQEWVSVKDRLPMNDTYILVTTDGVTASAYWHKDRFFAFTANGVATVGGVTHWMPLPQPPKGE